MTPFYSDGQEQATDMNKINLVEYMKRHGHIPTYVDEQITVFVLPASSAGEMIVTINNPLNWLESVTTIIEENILDLVSLVFQVSREQVLADPSAYGLGDDFGPETSDEQSQISSQ